MQRDLGIETLRTAAMFWIVLAHVAGISAGAGLGYSETPTMRYIMQTVGFFPVPMFVLISGYLYARKPTRSGQYSALTVRMLRSLLLPAVGVGILLYAAKSLMSGLELPFFSGLAAPLLYPDNHLWFLYALLWVYLIVGALDTVGALGSPYRWAFLSVAVLAIELGSDVPTTFLALNKVPYTLGFFLLGYGLNRYEKKFWPEKYLWIVMLPSLLIVAFNQWSWFNEQDMQPEIFKILERSTSWLLLPLMILYRPTISWMAILGPLTFIIYLFHPFGAVAARILLLRFTEIDTPIILFCICYAFSVVTSLLVYWGGAAALRRVSEHLNSKPADSHSQLS